MRSMAGISPHTQRGTHLPDTASRPDTHRSLKPISLSSAPISRLCWLNASLTAIAHTPELREAVLTERERLTSINAATRSLPQPSRHTQQEPRNTKTTEEAFLYLANAIKQLDNERKPSVRNQNNLLKAMVDMKLIVKPFLNCINRRQDPIVIIGLLGRHFGLDSDGPLSVFCEDVLKNEATIPQSSTAVAVIMGNPPPHKVPTTLSNPPQRWQLRSTILIHKNHSLAQIEDSENPNKPFYVNDKRVTRKVPFGGKGVPWLIFYDREPQTAKHRPCAPIDKSQTTDPKMKN